MAESYTHFEAEQSRISWTSSWLALPVFLIGLLVALTGPGGSAAAQTYSGPHGSFSEDSNFCLVCHDVHDAPGAKLGRYAPESAICFTCHNGTGSNYNTQIQMNNDPATNAMHPIIVNLPSNPGTYNYSSNTTAGIAPAGPYNCSQCHAPHGDVGYNKLLKARYDTNEYVNYSPSPDPYALCWSCHNVSTIVNDNTFFKEHNKHIIDKQSSCTACHFSPHGVAFVELIRFNPFFVTKSVSANSGPTFADNGDHHGSCTLTCHGEDHGQESY
jgi:predicted CXXCH cytochrome family protein